MYDKGVWSGSFVNLSATKIPLKEWIIKNNLKLIKYQTNKKAGLTPALYFNG